MAPNTEEGLRIYPNKINSFIQKSEKVGFPPKPEFDGNLRIKTHFLPKTKMVRMVHANHFYEISLQIGAPKIEFLMKTHFFENGHVQNVGK